MGNARWVRSLLLAAWTALVPPLATAQAFGLEIVRPDGSSLTLSAEALHALPRSSFDATAHDKTHRFEGTDLREVLRAAGVDMPAESKGPLLRRVIAAHAVDGYVVAFAWAEIDASIGAKVVNVVDSQDGKPLAQGDGPWRLVVPSEARPTRWAKQVVRLVVSNAQ